MSKFKVGDRVVYTSTKGHIAGTVKELGMSVCVVECDGEEYYWLYKSILLDVGHAIESFIQANPRISKGALIEGIKTIINDSR